MAIATPRDLFVHELSIALSAEQLIAELLPIMRQEATNPLLKEGFARHLVDTQQQATNLLQIFDLLGATPDGSPCYPAEGMRREHDMLIAGNPPAAVLDLGLLDGAIKTEHFEIGAYAALISFATALHESRAAGLLRENLRQEQYTAEQLELVVAKRLGEVAKMAIPA